MRTRLVLAAAAALVAVASLDGKVKLETNYDKAFNFGGLKTWAWHPDDPGRVSALPSLVPDANALEERIAPTINTTVEQELPKRGLRQAEAAAADAYLAWHAIVGENSVSTQMGYFAGVYALPTWGTPTTYARFYAQGAVLIGVISRSEKRMVWHGIAQAELHFDRDPVQRQKTLHEAVRNLIRRFPPK
jgi:Domain of unknown function (DUF4136)